VVCGLQYAGTDKTLVNHYFLIDITATANLLREIIMVRDNFVTLPGWFTRDDINDIILVSHKQCVTCAMCAFAVFFCFYLLCLCLSCTSGTILILNKINKLANSHNVK